MRFLQGKAQQALWSAEAIQNVCVTDACPWLHEIIGFGDVGGRVSTEPPQQHMVTYGDHTWPQIVQDIPIL